MLSSVRDWSTEASSRRKEGREGGGGRGDGEGGGGRGDGEGRGRGGGWGGQGEGRGMGRGGGGEVGGVEGVVVERTGERRVGMKKRNQKKYRIK